MAGLIGEASQNKAGLMPTNALFNMGNIGEKELSGVRNGYGYQTYFDAGQAGTFVTFGNVSPLQIKACYDGSWIKYRIYDPTKGAFTAWKSLI